MQVHGYESFEVNMGQVKARVSSSIEQLGWYERVGLKALFLCCFAH